MPDLIEIYFHYICDVTPCRHIMMPKMQGRKEEVPCGYPIKPKMQGGKEEAPCGCTMMPRMQGGKEERS